MSITWSENLEYKFLIIGGCLTCCLLVLSTDTLYKQFGPRSGPIFFGGLLWIQTVLKHSDGTPEKNSRVLILKKSADKRNHEKFPSIQRGLIICILETPKRVHMQTVYTQMKCSISSGSALFAKIKTTFTDRNTS